MKKRLEKLRSFLESRQLDGIIISKPENRRYFSGFTGSAGILLVTHSEAKLLTDFRYTEQAAGEAALYEIILYGAQGIYAEVNSYAHDFKLHKIAFESDYVTYAGYSSMIQALPEIELVPVELDVLRSIKDKVELSYIKQAVEIADAAFTHILSFIKPGISEQAVALELEYKMKSLGAENIAFDTIVASGKRGAMPHGQPTEKLIETGDLVTMDFGAVYKGYHSDITRTVSVGKANAKQRKIYEIVLAAQLAGVRAVRAGLVGREIDAVARKLIKDAGFGEYFGHGLGHAVGLFIHEEPRLSPSNSSVKLEKNMVVTVEPGIYLPDWGGIRIEDTVVVCDAGCEVLTASSKQLIEL
ncbi:MAG: Xaa-Pro peptidase family protein [Pelosinus sp.]|nr:Xaa-Pro peptidase family protein [Pelosinus sp.]